MSIILKTIINNITFQNFIPLIPIIPATVMAWAIIDNKNIAKANLLHDWIKEERQLRTDIDNIHNIENKEVSRWERLFNFYEGLAIYIINKKIVEIDAKEYFVELVKKVYECYKDQKNKTIKNKKDYFGFNDSKSYKYLKNLIIRWKLNKDKEFTD